MNAATTRRDQPTVYHDSTSRGSTSTQVQRGHSSTSYGFASTGPSEGSRAAGKRPAQGSLPAAEKYQPNFHVLIAIDYGSPPTTSAAIGSTPSFGYPGGSYHVPSSSLASTQFGISNSKARLDPNDFFVRKTPQKFFVPGKVFIKLHTEDATSGPTTDHSSFGFSTVAYAELAYSQLRRFVVVKAKSKENYCLCIPITTYSGRGAGKKGVDQRAHAIIYTGSHPPDKLPIERDMNKSAICVVPTRADEKLDPISRVNMGKIYTVEWNAKVKDMGHVEKNSLVRLLAYWKQIINTPFGLECTEEPIRFATDW
ncbi:MAG: hypothetical protein Q9173_004709 [Seirophora scorigena]